MGTSASAAHPRYQKAVFDTSFSKQTTGLPLLPLKPTNLSKKVFYFSNLCLAEHKRGRPVIRGRSPVQTVCINCNMNVITETEAKTGLFQYVAAAG